MRLYERIDVIKVDGIPCDGVTTLLSPTDETYPSTEAFLSHARNNGERYEGKSWLLLSEHGEDNVITIEKEVAFKVVQKKGAA